MKAIKLTKIDWNLNNVDDTKKEEVLRSLPKQMGFTVDDDFCVADKVPGCLKKKYGYEINDFAFVEIHIAESLEELLYMNARKTKNKKSLYKAGGKLSAYGEEAVRFLESRIRQRLALEFKGVSDFEMPKSLDEVMLGVEKVGNIKWEKHTVEELMKPIISQIRDKKAVNLKDAYDYAMESNEEEEED